MMPATAPDHAHGEARLLVIDPERGRLSHLRAIDLARLLHPSDLVVLNDAATLPASFRLPELDAELRLVSKGGSDCEYRAVLFGAGDFRVPTERRGAPPAVRPGARLVLGHDLMARVLRVDASARRLIDLRFELEGPALLQALYRHGRPIQYAYVPEALQIWDVQNRFSSRPWAMELPSAGRAFDGELLLAVRRRGAGIAVLTHGAGISSTGSESLDSRLPLPEPYEIPDATARAIKNTRERGGRVLAVGTTVVRALEDRARETGHVRAGRGEATLVLARNSRTRVTDGVFSGMHEAGTSHFALLEAYAPRPLLERALEEAERLGYRQHEFGDFCVVWPPAEGATLRRAQSRKAPSPLADTGRPETESHRVAG